MSWCASQRVQSVLYVETEDIYVEAVGESSNSFINFCCELFSEEEQEESDGGGLSPSLRKMDPSKNNISQLPAETYHQVTRGQPLQSPEQASGWISCLHIR